jgi:hypothetical protein
MSTSTPPVPVELMPKPLPVVFFRPPYIALWVTSPEFATSLAMPVIFLLPLNRTEMTPR